MLFILALYRWFLTMLCFVYVFVGGSLLSLTYFNYLKLFYKDEDIIHKKARHAIFVTFNILIQSAVFLRLIDLKFHDFDKLDNDGGSLIIANHPTYIDYVILASKIDNINCIIKEDIASNFLLKNVVKTAGLIVNTASDDSLLTFQKALDKNQKIVIFPEGTRTIDKDNIKLKRGFAQLALRLPASMRLVYIHCTQDFLSKKSSWNTLYYKKPIYNFYAKDFFDLNDLNKQFDDKNFALKARHLTLKVEKLFNSFTK